MSLDLTKVLERARHRLQGGGGYDSEMAPEFAQALIDLSAQLAAADERAAQAEARAAKAEQERDAADAHADELRKLHEDTHRLEQKAINDARRRAVEAEGRARAALARADAAEAGARAIVKLIQDTADSFHENPIGCYFDELADKARALSPGGREVLCRRCHQSESNHRDGIGAARDCKFEPAQ